MEEKCQLSIIDNKMEGDLNEIDKKGYYHADSIPEGY